MSRQPSYDRLHQALQSKGQVASSGQPPRSAPNQCSEQQRSALSILRIPSVLEVICSVTSP